MLDIITTKNPAHLPSFPSDFSSSPTPEYPGVLPIPLEQTGSAPGPSGTMQDIAHSDSESSAASSSTMSSSATGLGWFTPKKPESTTAKKPDPTARKIRVSGKMLYSVEWMREHDTTDQSAFDSAWQRMPKAEREALGKQAMARHAQVKAREKAANSKSKGPEVASRETRKRERT